MDILSLNRRFAWLWSRLENLVEANLRLHDDPRSPDATEDTDADTVETANNDLPDLRECYYAAQTLKRIYDGRRAALQEGQQTNDPHTHRPRDTSPTSPTNVPDSIQTLLRRGPEN